LSATEPKPLPSTVVRDDEAQLVSAAKSGDIPAFEELVNRYERKIFRLGMNITQNREDAEDVMQEAFLKSYTHLDRFQGDSRFYTWLVRIAVNEALMKLRKRRPNQVSLDEPLTDGEDSVFREIEDWGRRRSKNSLKRNSTKFSTASSESWIRFSAWPSCCATWKEFRQKNPRKSWESPRRQ